MSSLLDVLGATIAGSLVLLMIFGALSNMQVISYNTQLQISLTEMAEDMITGRKLGDEDQLGLESILSYVGAGVITGQASVLEATSNSFKFVGKTNPNSPLRTFYLVQEEDSTSFGFPLYVYQDVMTPNNHILGPFWLAEPMSMKYYDVNSTLIVDPSINYDLIRSIEVNLTFFYDTHQPDIDKRLLRHSIVFWKYFKNRYL